MDAARVRRPLAANLLAEVFARTGLLHDEAELMLRQSLADPTNHIAVLRSIVHGHNRDQQISERTRLAPAHVTKLLDALERLGLVERLRPITASPRARKTAYAISDPEIDVVGVDGDRRPLVVGMCKWTGRPVGAAELNLLDHLAPPAGAGSAQRYLFSRSGFANPLVNRAEHDPTVTLLTPADIYR